MVAALREAMRPGAKLVAVLVHGSAIALDDATLGAPTLCSTPGARHRWRCRRRRRPCDFSPAGRTAVTYRSTLTFPRRVPWHGTLTRPPIQGFVVPLLRGRAAISVWLWAQLHHIPLQQPELGAPAHSDTHGASHGPCDAVQGPCRHQYGQYSMRCRPHAQPNTTVPAPAVRLAVSSVHVPRVRPRVALRLLPDTRAVMHGGEAVGRSVHSEFSRGGGG